MAIITKLEEKAIQIKEHIGERLSFKEIVELVKGSNDIQKRANVILSPKLPQTATNLSSNQVEFIAISYAIVEDFPQFQGLKDYADQFLLTSISKEGWGVDRMIAHEQAINEKRMMQLGLKQVEGGKQQDVK